MDGSKVTDAITIIKDIVQVNKEPIFISGSVSSATVAQKGSLEFKSIWQDPENNSIEGVKVRYRRDGSALGINYNWKEYYLTYIMGSPNDHPAFNKTIQIDEPEGTYEFELQASDTEKSGGTALHTTAWQGLGNFSVVAVTNNQPPTLNLIKAPIIVRRCQPFSLTFQVSDPDKNLREVQVDWSGKGTSGAQPLHKGTTLLPNGIAYRDAIAK